MLGILGTWASQLLHQRLEILEQVTRLYLKGTAANIADLSKALRYLISRDSDQRPPVFLVLDGLDECESATRKQLLSLVAETLADAKILVVSRDEMDIRSAIQSIGGDDGFAAVRIKEEDTRDDIDQMIFEEVKRLDLEEDELKLKVQSRLKEGARGMFLWIWLMVEHLCKQSTIEEIEEALENLPEGLDAAYGRIMDHIQCYSESRRIAAIKILQWAVCVSRPLTVTELAVALAITPGEKNFKPKKQITNPQKTILKLCAPLIELEARSQSLKIVHATAKEFLLNKAYQSMQQRARLVEEQHIHSLITCACLTYLTYERATANVTVDVEASVQELENHHAANPFLEYSSLNWWYHADIAIIRGERKAIETEGQLHQVMMGFSSSELSTVKWLQSLHYLLGKGTSGFEARERCWDPQSENIRNVLQILVKNWGQKCRTGFPELSNWFTHFGIQPWHHFSARLLPVYAYPLIHIAANFNFLSAVKAGVADGVSLEELDHLGQTPLLTAARGEALTFSAAALMLTINALLVAMQL